MHFSVTDGGRFNFTHSMDKDYSWWEWDRFNIYLCFSFVFIVINPEKLRLQNKEMRIQGVLLQHYNFFHPSFILKITMFYHYKLDWCPACGKPSVGS